jgi:branched-chain amino acid aminotransferase
MRVTWFNGRLVEGEIALDPQDRGLLLGDGVFETISVLHGKAQWLDLHLARMQSAASELGIPFDHDAIVTGMSAVLHTKDAIPRTLRITLTRGRATGGFSADGAEPGLLILADRFDLSLMHQPVTLATAGIRRNESAPSSRLKTLSYIDGIMAAREVKGRADDALMLNTSGRIACSTIANIFILSGGELRTPAPGEGILAGIMRGRVLETAARIGYVAREMQLMPEDLLSADAVFLTNSVRIIRPVTHLDGQALRSKGLAELMDAMKPHLLEGSDT